MVLNCLPYFRYVGLSSSGISYKSSTASFGSSSSSFQSRDRYGGGLSGTGDEDSYDSFKQEKSRKDSYTKSHRRGISDDQDSTLKKGSAGFGRFHFLSLVCWKISVYFPYACVGIATISWSLLLYFLIVLVNLSFKENNAHITADMIIWSVLGILVQNLS